jgi:hypothetical protein
MQCSPSVSLRARSLDIPATSHLNRMPFSGVPAKIDAYVGSNNDKLV